MESWYSEAMRVGRELGFICSGRDDQYVKLTYLGYTVKVSEQDVRSLNIETLLYAFQKGAEKRTNESTD